MIVDEDLFREFSFGVVASLFSPIRTEKKSFEPCCEALPEPFPG